MHDPQTIPSSGRRVGASLRRIRSRGVGYAARAALLCGLLVAPGLAGGSESAAAEPAIPPGQEELMAAMLGKGEWLVGDCQLVAAGAQYTFIEATYGCPDGEVVFKLTHPSQAAATATQTEEFAIAVQSGTSPSGLTDDLVSHVRSQEADFEWTWPGAEAADASGDDSGDESGDESGD